MGDPRSQIQGFGKLVEVSIVHRRLTSTLEMVNSLRSMYSRLSHLSSLLSADRSDPLGPSPNLLPIHYHLTELETFRNETLAQANKSALTKEKAAQTIQVLDKYFERLGETIEAFEAHYFRLSRELLALTRKGNSSVAVKLCKIAEVEGARDQRAIAIRMVKKSGNLDVASRFRSLHADARTIKHYRSKVLEQIREGCKTEVEKSFRRAEEDGVRWIEELEWVYDDLDLVREKLVDKFPEDWKVSDHSITARRREIHETDLNRSANPDSTSLVRSPTLLTRSSPYPLLTLLYLSPTLSWRPSSTFARIPFLETFVSFAQTDSYFRFCPALPVFHHSLLSRYLTLPSRFPRSPSPFLLNFAQPVGSPLPIHFLLFLGFSFSLTLPSPSHLFSPKSST